MHARYATSAFCAYTYWCNTSLMLMHWILVAGASQLSRVQPLSYPPYRWKEMRWDFGLGEHWDVSVVRPVSISLYALIRDRLKWVDEVCLTQDGD